MRPFLHRLRPAASALAALVVLAGVSWQAGRWGRDAAIADLGAAARTSLRLHLAALGSELDKHRSVPLVLSQDPDVTALLDHPGDPARVAQVNGKLARLDSRIHAGVIYVMDEGGTTLAASNWQSATSFVGHNFSFRPYFRAAMASGIGTYFAMGTTSLQPGYYLAQRAGDADHVGVVVVKIAFDDMEAAWQGRDEHVFVTDPDGVVLITDLPDWRFRTLGPLTEPLRRALRHNLQFGAAPLAPLPVTARGSRDGGRVVRVAGDDPRRPPRDYLDLAAPVPATGWTLHLLTPLDPAATQGGATAVAIAALASSGLLAAGWFLAYRRTLQRRRARDQQRLLQQLELRVAARTAALTRTNARLMSEIEERRLTESRLRQAQDELVQAAKLAALGQIAASISHEINQPLAAIRSFTDNAAVLLDRRRLGDVAANLASVAQLTDRIAGITRSLKGFARKASTGVEAVSVRAAVEGCLSLLEHRLRRDSILVVRDLPDADIKVWGEEVRLEQVLINLVQNAADALAGRGLSQQAVGSPVPARPAPEIRIAVALRETTVLLSVADNGPGIEPERMEHLFAAFFTTKQAEEGLGLGLSIAQGIVHDFGGEISVANRPEGGAMFTVELRRADG